MCTKYSILQARLGSFALVGEIAARLGVVHTPLIRVKRISECEVSLQSQFQDSQGYIVKSFLIKLKPKPKPKQPPLPPPQEGFVSLSLDKSKALSEKNVNPDPYLTP